MSAPSAPAASVSNAQVAGVLDEIADLLEVQGGNPFRIRAYRDAARVVGALGRSLADRLAAGDRLDDLRGIGPDLAGKIEEVLASGTCAQLESLRRETAPGLAELLQLPGLGPRRVQRLHAALGIASLQELQQAARQGLLQTVQGFGASTEQRLLEVAQQRLQVNRRVPLPEVAGTVGVLLADLIAVRGVQQVVAAGSFRRRRETVGDIDLLATATAPGLAMAALTRHAGVARVLARGTTRASVVLASSLQVDLRVVAPGSLGAAWLYFTGSKAHNIALRRLAQDAGYKLNEYGLYQDARRIAGSTEESVYEALGLAWIPPELREDRGEIDAARAGTLPRLVELTDLRGDLHVHAAPGLGGVGLRALAQEAIGRKLEYLAITARLHGARGAPALDAAGVGRLVAAVDRLNEGFHGFTLLKNLEVEILEDGRLGLPPGIDLSGIDLVTGVVLHGLDLARAKQTERLLRAMDDPRFTILAHPGNRVLGERGASEFDLERVLRHAATRGCFVEANALPQRLDLDDIGCRMARDLRVPVSIASEASEPAGLGGLLWGVGQARRGWLEAAHVLNARSLPQLRPLLAAALGRPVREPAPA